MRTRVVVPAASGQNMREFACLLLEKEAAACQFGCWGRALLVVAFETACSRATLRLLVLCLASLSPDKPQYSHRRDAEELTNRK